MNVIEQKSRCDLCQRSSFDVVQAVDVRVALCPSCAMRVGEAALAVSADWWPTVWKVSKRVGQAMVYEQPWTSEELETHDDLAVAYAEMGLLPEAFGEAALVLSKLAGRAASASALNILFNEHAAYPGAINELRRRVFPS